MSGVFGPRMGILPPAQRRLWNELGPTSGRGFVLYGGTAIALRLGHRASVDFDFFCEAPLNRTEMRTALPFLDQATVVQDERNSMSVLVPYGDTEHTHVKVSFFGAIGIGRVGEPDMTSDGMLEVASLDDLMALKLKVILQRAEAKDYRDIAAMVAAGVDLPKGLAAARELFGPNFQPSESLKALVYFNDGDLGTLTKNEKAALVQAAGSVRDLPAATIVSKVLSANRQG